MSARNAVLSGFWGFGLLNNLLYVVILSAAIDLVGTRTPKGLVLLADVLPSFLFKVTAPFYFHVVPYTYRIALLIGLSFTGMVFVALSPALGLKLFGIVLASISSGLGEVTFLQLTHYYGESAVHAWSSGTGGAGLAGSFVFMLLTSYLRLSTKTTLLLFSLMPFFVGVIYFFVIPPSPALITQAGSTYESLPVSRDEELPTLSGSSQDPSSPNDDHSGSRPPSDSKTQRIQRLLVPFILPLMTVYIAEYVINQGVSPTLLFDLHDMPMFHTYRDAYVMYGTLYQIGVFISRSSAPFFRTKALWLMAVLQALNLFLAIVQSLFFMNRNIYLNFLFMIYEGLLGGLAYVNTFLLVSESVPRSEREFSMGAVTMSDSSGVVIAALISMLLERNLCQYQVNHGRPWCEL